MIQEEALIPYQTSPLPEGPWIVFAPHPDDETFGMGGTLLLAAKKAVEVTLVVLTDGSMGGGETGFDNIISIREQEVAEVSKRLHLEALRFWRQPGRGLKLTPDLINRVTKLILKVKPASVFFPSPMELHPDHRAASALVWEGLRNCPSFEGKAFAYEISVQCPTNRLVDITAVSDEKRALAVLYQSQMAERDHLTAMLALNRTRAYTLPSNVQSAEAFFAYEKIGDTHLSLYTLNNLRPYWSEANVSRTPLVSVIIRTVNRPAMLKNALESLAGQIYPEIEALVINDGGKDISDVVSSFKGSVSKLRYVPLNPNQGRSRAANMGLQEAAGQYLMFLDDDDWLYPDHIAKLVDALEKEETEQVAYTGVECLSETAPGRWERVHVFDDPFDPVLLLIRNFIPIHSALFRRELTDDGCRFDENLNIYEDWDFWVQLGQKSNFRNVEGVSAAYRIGGKGGFGVAGDLSLQYQSQQMFFEKWRRLWSHQQLSGIISYALHEMDFRFLKNEVKTKQDQISSLQAELQEIQPRFKSYLDQIRALTDQLNEANQTLKEKQNELETTQQLPAEIQSINNDLTKTQSALAETQWNLEVKERAIQDLRATLSQTQNDTKTWMNRFKELETSRIWRFTKPARTLVTVLKIASNRILYNYRRFKHHTKRSIEIYHRQGIAPLLNRYRAEISSRNKKETIPFSQGQITPPEMIEVETEGTVRLANTLKFPHHESPLVSVIIPVFNQVEFTVRCLASILKYLPAATFEIMVIDDGSTDSTEQLIGTIPNVRYLKNKTNLGFLRSCNKAAADARGAYIMFLNNDTQVLSGWLDSLYNVFETVQDAGMVGSKLVYPSGHLQEAGSVLKKDGTVELIGLNDHPEKPHYNFLREVDHCSAASLLVEGNLFKRVGGFNDAYAPAYFEDADLSLQVRRNGKKVIYQPESVVVHALSVTTNGTNGHKQQQIETNREKYLARWEPELTALNKIRLIAFYLPQYHPIPENDAWWGTGFTEWSNVTRARPIFEGHFQPRLPGDLGFYDLRLPEVREAQANLARTHGIYGFCYYYYWFSGKRLLHRPLDEMLRSGKPDFPFCVCWANENWSRRWDGQDSKILIEQTYSEEDDHAFISDLAPALRDERYIRVNGKPLVLVYRVGLLPNPAKTAQIWREYCDREGIGDLYLASVQSFGEICDPEPFGFDAAVEFPPQAMATRAEPPPNMFSYDFKGMFFDYEQTARQYIQRPPTPYKRFRTVMPGWDNTARRKDKGHIFLNVNPTCYEQWLKAVVEETRKFKFDEEKLVFINAWNEWAEGNHLEPDTQSGREYLEATLRALGEFAETEEKIET